VDSLSYKTASLNTASVQKQWILIDANGQILGRLVTKIAKILRGKHKTGFTPHVDCGDNVIVINAEKIRMTGKKLTDRVHFTYSGYPGGQKSITPAELLKKHPTRMIEWAVKGMLPKTKLGRDLFRNLKAYAGDQHPHGAQNPITIDLEKI